MGAVEGKQEEFVVSRSFDDGFVQLSVEPAEEQEVVRLPALESLALLGQFREQTVLRDPDSPMPRCLLDRGLRRQRYHPARPDLRRGQGR